MRGVLEDIRGIISNDEQNELEYTEKEYRYNDTIYGIATYLRYVNNLCINKFRDIPEQAANLPKAPASEEKSQTASDYEDR